MGTRLAGKVAIVTGAAARGEGVGNGSASAMLFAREGAAVVVVNRKIDRAEALAETIRAEGGKALAFAADVTKQEATEAMADCAMRHFGRIDILHNNVGVGAAGNAETISLDSWNRLYGTNVTSALLACKSCIPHMKAGGGGSILNVSSVAAFSTNPGNASYCSTKAWMNNFTEGLAIELRAARSAVRVQALCPGFTLTEFHDTLGVDRGGIPAWLWMKPADIVAASLRGLDQGRIIVVPGLAYKAVVAFLTHLPPYLRRHLKRPFRDKRT